MILTDCKKMCELIKLKHKLGKQVIDYDKTLIALDMDCGENLAVNLSSALGTRVLAVLETIERLKKLELEINGTIPKGLEKGEEEFREKLET